MKKNVLIFRIEKAEAEARKTVEKLEAQGIDAQNLTPEEMAKAMMEGIHPSVTKPRTHFIRVSFQACRISTRQTTSSPNMTSSRKYCFLVLIGLPGSGKTSLAKSLCRHLAAGDSNASVVRISYDELIPLDSQAEMARDETSGEWKEARKNVLATLDALISEQDDLAPEVAELLDKLVPSDQRSELKDKVTLVIDDNNYYSSMRYELCQVARKFEAGFCQIYVKCQASVAANRNAERPVEARVPPEVIEKMAAKLEEPSPLKNGWEAFSFSVDGEKEGFFDDPTVFETIKSVTELAFGNPAKTRPDNREERDRSRKACSASVIHQADKILRKRIGERMKTAKEEGKDKAFLAARSAELNEARTELLEDLKTGFTKLPREVVDACSSSSSKAMAKYAESGAAAEEKPDETGLEPRNVPDASEPEQSGSAEEKKPDYERLAEVISELYDLKLGRGNKGS